MQIRTAILIAGTTAAMIAPNAFARIPSDELDGGGAATTATHAKTVNGVNKRSNSFHFATTLAPTTENSYGQHKSNGTKNGAAKPTGRPRPLPPIIIPVLPSSGATQVAPDPNACADNGSECTDQQLCDLWGENCDVAAAEQAQPVAMGEQQY